jgi:hypothetical protein
MNSTASRLALISAIAAIVAGCGGGDAESGSGPTTAAPQNGTVALLLSDASTEDWATIGVKVHCVGAARRRRSCHRVYGAFLGSHR